jgi:hypothetical protein
MVSADKDEEEKIQEQSSNNAVQKDDAWTKLLFDYHKAILSTWILVLVIIVLARPFQRYQISVSIISILLRRNKNYRSRKRTSSLSL